MGKRARWAAVHEAAPAVGLLVVALLPDQSSERGVLWWMATLAGLLLILACWSGAYALRGRLVPGLPVLAFQVTHTAPAPGRAEFVAGGRPGDAARWSGPVVLGSLLVAGWAAGSGSVAGARTWTRSPRGRGTSSVSASNWAPSPSPPSARGSAESCTTLWPTACR